MEEESAFPNEVQNQENQECSVFKGINLSPESAQEGDADSPLSPLGLKLRKTPSFLNLVETKLSQSKKKDGQNPKLERHFYKSKLDDLTTQHNQEKLKATNFPAMLLRIGNWQWISEHEGDLTTKLYYGKRKMVWEVLGGALKSKIEIQWSDITAIRATIRDKEPEILEIELNQRPLFFGEIDPQPRKHTLWQQSIDFTGGQASIFRRHYVSFAPGTLGKHYEKILQCDPQLFLLSQKPFPSQESPYFNSPVYGYLESSFTLSGYESKFLPRMQYFHETDLTPPFIPDQRQRAFGDRKDFIWGESQDRYGMEDIGGISSNTRLLIDAGNHLLGDNKFRVSNNETLFSTVVSPMIEPPLDGNSITTFTNPLTINYQSTLQGIDDNNAMIWLYHQDSNGSSDAGSTMSNSIYQNVLPTEDSPTNIKFHE